MKTAECCAATGCALTTLTVAALLAAASMSGCADGCRGPARGPGHAAEELLPIPPLRDPFAGEAVAAGDKQPTSPARPGLPDDTFVAVGASSAAEAAATWKRLTSDPRTAPGVLASNIGMLGFANHDWLDGAKPVWLMLVDPQGADFGEALLLYHTGKEAVLAAIPAGGPDPGSHAGAMAGAGATVTFVDFVGEDRLLVSRRASLFAGIEASLGKALSDPMAVPARGLSLHVDLVRLAERMGESVDALREWDGQPIAGMFLPIPPSILVPALDNLRYARLSVDADDQSVNIALTGDPLPGSALALAAPALAGRTALDLATLAPGTWAGASTSVATPGPVATAAVVAAAEHWSRFLDLTPDEYAAANALFEELVGLWTGRAALQILETSEAGFPAATGLLLQVSDGMRARVAYDGLLAMLWDRGLVRWQDGEIGPESLPPPSGDFETLSDLLVAVNEPFESVGVSFDASRRRDELTLDALRVSIDWSKFADGETSEAVRTMIGSRVGLAVAFRDRQVAVAFGPTATADAVDLVSGQWTPGPAGLPRVARGTAMHAALLLRTLFEIYHRVMPEEPVPLEMAPPGAIVELSARALGGWPELRIGVPRSVVTWVISPMAAGLSPPGAQIQASPPPP